MEYINEDAQAIVDAYFYWAENVDRLDDEELDFEDFYFHHTGNELDYEADWFLEMLPLLQERQCGSCGKLAVWICDEFMLCSDCHE